jgi:hypothetical protein
MKLVNLMGIPVTLLMENGALEIPPSDTVLKFKSTKKLVAILGDKDTSVPVYRTVYKLAGLPNKIEEDALYIVPVLAVEAIKSILPPDLTEHLAIVTDLEYYHPDIKVVASSLELVNVDADCEVWL